jgi:SET domain-containing protein
MSRSILVRRSPIHGNGVFAAADLPAGQTLIQYRGRLLSHAQADRRFSGNVDTGHTFLFVLNSHYVIDASVDGNSARWINHSCAPNCEPMLHESRRQDPAADRIFIQTLRPVRAGEELTYNYGIELTVRHTARMKRLWACRCGARNCSGTILQDKRRPARA